MGGLLIDQQGTAWSTGSHDIASRLGALLRGGADLVGLAVWKLGFIHVRQISNGLLVVFWPGLTGMVALASAFYEITGRHPERIVLSYEPTGCSQEMFTDLSQAFARMDELVNGSQPAERPGIRAERRSIDQIGEIAGGRMLDLFRAWSGADGHWSPEFVHNLIEQGLLDDAVIVRQPARSEQLFIQHWGRRRQLLGGHWARSAVGREVEDQPYPYLVPWVAATYRASMAAAEPQLHSVESVIVTPRGTVRSRRYDRLLLPFTDDSGKRFAVTVNLDSAADAPS